MLTPDEEQDRRDVQGALAGNEDAFAALVERYQELVSRQMWRFTRDPQTLEELVQDVFVEVYQSLAGFRGDAPFLHWLRRIATRVGYRYWKQKARDERRRDALAAWRAEAAQSPENISPSEAAEAIFGLLAELPPKDRLVLTLMYFEECDTHEIADRTGWTRTLAKVRAHRARKKLKNLLDEAGYGRTGHE